MHEEILAQANMIARKIAKLKLHLQLDQKTKDLVRESYMAAINNMGEEEYEYILKKIERKIEITKDASTTWIAQLSTCYETLFEIFENHNSGNQEQLSFEAIRLIGAALFYFINPFDIIPDYTPGIGYADDLFVLIMCMKTLPKRDNEIVNQYFSEIDK